MIVTPNEYLDVRRPEWLDAEVIGRVRYDPSSRAVVILRCPEIEAAFAVHVSSDIRAVLGP